MKLATNFHSSQLAHSVTLNSSNTMLVIYSGFGGFFFVLVVVVNHDYLRTKKKIELNLVFFKKGVFVFVSQKVKKSVCVIQEGM